MMLVWPENADATGSSRAWPQYCAKCLWGQALWRGFSRCS